MDWRSWLRRNLATLVAIAIIAFLVISASLLTSEVLEDETTSVDNAILRAMRDESGAPIGPAWLSRAIIDLSTLGSTTIAGSVVVVACISLLLARRRAHALVVAVCGIGSAFAITVMKDSIGRERPDVIHALAVPGGFSFPSGHTFTASAIYPLLGLAIAHIVSSRSLKIFVLGITAAIVFVVGFSRVYLGVHYPTDVVAGWAFGLVWAIACALLGKFLLARGGGPSPGGPSLGPRSSS